MSIRVFIEDNKLLIEYSPDNGVKWIDEIVKTDEEFTLKRTFTFRQQDFYEYNETDDSERTFVIGFIEDGYFRIEKRILDTTQDVLIHTSVRISIKTFISNNDFSIFKRFDRLANQQIIIGGDKYPNSIPEEVFIDILNSLPSTTELRYYIDSRITNVLTQYLENVKDSGKAFERYLDKRITLAPFNSLDSLKGYETEKYAFILDNLKTMLENSNSYSENDWQNKILEIILLLYPKYIKCFSEVRINDYYSNPTTTTERRIDLMLVDSIGNIDVIEIKKPFEFCVVTKNVYRDNYTPLKELSGTIMQVEKYLFHLNKWGVNGEKALTLRYQSQLPNELSIKVTNPKGLIIIGRDYNLSESQRFDFEIIKRKYSNIMDIITYDDLLKRLENIINRFRI